jgi:hypothetical protein
MPQKRDIAVTNLEMFALFYDANCMEPSQLAEIQEELDRLSSRVTQMTNSTTDESFNKRPKAGSWSAAECVIHLSLTTGAYLPLIDQALATGSSKRMPPTHHYRRDFKGWLLCWMLEPPARMKVKTTKLFEPVATKTRIQIIGEFSRYQAELKTRVTNANGRDLEHISLASPFNSKVQYNLYSAFSVLLVHQRRHLWQAEQALKK